MSLCDRCFAPGQCCKTIELFNMKSEPVTFWVDDLPAQLAEYGLPFEPIHEIGRWSAPDGREYAGHVFRCTALTAEGRCSIYETRPDLCRRFEPASGSLCVHFGGAEAGAL